MKKFFGVIGNPPYQADPEQGSSRSLPIYDSFIDEAYRIADRVELVTPARFLFNAGQTKKSWNKKMLSDEHLKVLVYEQDATKVFPTTTLTGGIAVTYHDAEKKFRPIGKFIAWDQLRSILEKAGAPTDAESLASIADSQNNYNFDALYTDHPDYSQYISGNGKHSQLKSNALSKVPIFTDSKQKDDDIRILGLVDGARTWKWVHRRYLDQRHSNLFTYKAILAVSNGGAGNLGEKPVNIIGKPLISKPGEGYTQTFMAIGAFDNIEEAANLSKYILTKFCRVLVGILKATQASPPITWKYVPLQDFTSKSDIDWSKPISEIDQLLYEKYGLSDEEIEFIETHVKEMS